MPGKKLNILFCTPPERPVSGAFNAFTEGGSSFPSLGLLILAQIARDKGHHVSFRDLLNEKASPEQALSTIEQIKPDILCISSNTDMVMHASGLASDIKRKGMGVRVIIGGPHVSAVPAETMERCPGFDIGVIGEGERAFTALLESGFSHDALAGIKGIVFRDSGRIVTNGPGPFIEDLDTLPFPAWDLIPDMKLYRPAVTNFKREPVFSVMTSRGCSGWCIFCDRGVFGNKVRMHSAAYVISMIKLLRSRYGIREITFYDDNMVFEKKRLVEICEALIKEKDPLTWSCSARVDRVDGETLKLMKRAGCWQISYGIESGSPAILKAIQKGITVRQVRKTLALTRGAGISTRGYFIIGNPGETRATLDESFNFMLELPLDDVLVEYMTPYPGTELYREAAKYGAMPDDWSTMNSYGINFVPHGLDKKILEDHFYRMYRSFYMRPRQIVSYLGRLKSPKKIFDLGVKYIKFSSANKG